MFLNKKKIIRKEKKVLAEFLNFPTLALNDYLQMGDSAKSFLEEIKSVRRESDKTQSQKSFRFRFSGSQNSFFQLQKFKKNKNYYRNFKNLLVLSNNLFRTQKFHRFFVLKQVKGGFRPSSLGLISFMPRSLSKVKVKLSTKSNFKLGNRQRLIRIKVLKKTKRFSFKKNLKVNIISSRKRKTMT
jgi:hypothetical protein